VAAQRRDDKARGGGYRRMMHARFFLLHLFRLAA